MQTKWRSSVIPVLLGLSVVACDSNEMLDPVPSKALQAGDFAAVPPLVPTATGRGGAAATVDVRGTLAAMEVLKRGGNAIDAAVASAAVLGVTDPFSCGLGGGGFMIIYLAGEGRVITIDHRETAPAGLDASAFYEGGMPIAFPELITSGLSVGVPGALRGWEEALRRYGTLGLGDVLQRAIWVAENGFDVDPTFFEQTERNLERFAQIESTRRIFLTADGAAQPLGTIVKNPDLAKTYRLIAEGGSAAFYEGEIAQAIVDTIASPPLVAGATLVVRPGVMQPADLANYEARVRLPVVSSYRGYTLYGMDVPSSGGLTVAMTLNLLSGYDPAGMARGEVLHRYLEASRLAFADRNAFMGDPAYVEVPREGLLSLDYADERRALINVAQASTVAAPPGDPYAHQTDPSSVDPGTGMKAQGNAPGDAAKETTHLTVSDAQGNIVSYTCTIESEGGNGMVVPGYGFLLNNELTDFNIPADATAPHPNVLEPGKRPRSSISPTIVLKDGKPILALGSPGGSTIITTVVQMLINHIDFGMPVDEALAAARVSQRNSPDATSQAEAAFVGTAEAAALTQLGHTLADVGAIGAAVALQFNADGTITAAAEPTRRNGGSAMVEKAP